MGFVRSIIRFKIWNGSQRVLRVSKRILREKQIKKVIPCTLNSSLERASKNNNVLYFVTQKNNLHSDALNNTNPSYKRQFLKRIRLCYIYFEKGYISSNCTMNYYCNKCRHVSTESKELLYLRWNEHHEVSILKH